MLRTVPRAGAAGMAALALVSMTGCSFARDGSCEGGSDAAISASPAPDAVEVFEEVPPLHPSVDSFPAGAVEVVADDGTVHRVAVRVAETSEQRAHGLMEVPELPDGAGMWFLCDEDRTGGFWMSNTLVPLDIAYVDAEGRIVSIEQAVPCPQDATACPSYPPNGPYRYTLEGPGGWFEQVGATAGARVRPVDG